MNKNLGLRIDHPPGTTVVPAPTRNVVSEHWTGEEKNHVKNVLFITVQCPIYNTVRM